MPDYEAPVDGWLTVSIDGDRVTRVSVDYGEEITLDIEPRGDD